MVLLGATRLGAELALLVPLPSACHPGHGTPLPADTPDGVAGHPMGHLWTPGIALATITVCGAGAARMPDIRCQWCSSLCRTAGRPHGGIVLAENAELRFPPWESNLKRGGIRLPGGPGRCWGGLR